MNSFSTSSSSSFLGSLGDIATGYLAARANMLLDQQAVNANTVSYNPAQYASGATTTSALTSSPWLYLVIGLVVLAGAVMVFKGHKK